MAGHHYWICETTSSPGSAIFCFLWTGLGRLHKDLFRSCTIAYKSWTCWRYLLLLFAFNWTVSSIGRLFIPFVTMRWKFSAKTARWSDSLLGVPECHGSPADLWEIRQNGSNGLLAAYRWSLGLCQEKGKHNHLICNLKTESANVAKWKRKSGKKLLLFIWTKS